ncbi:MAG: hypothetical protein CHACPFDD_03206 [Phycisphaerae bacterium]|nr:hypothetical protein [Phycisphaerae bacterium]
MPALDPHDLIDDDEIVFRRVSEKSGWYDAKSSRPVAWTAFKPNSNDHDGVSVWRAKYQSAADVAAIGARPGTRYFVLAIRVSQLRSAGAQIVPTPVSGAAGHASISSLRVDAYHESKDAVRALAERIANEIIEPVEGPFGPF